jgi:hypothetical protein
MRRALRFLAWKLTTNIIPLLALVVSIISAYVSYSTFQLYRQTGATQLEALQVLRVLEHEAATVREHNVDEAVRLYHAQATIRSISENQSWSGTEQIKRRYTELHRFQELAHVFPTVTIDPGGTFARVQAGTIGVIRRPRGDEIRISSVEGERWTLRKIDGAWVIMDFTYGLP